MKDPRVRSNAAQRTATSFKDICIDWANDKQRDAFENGPDPLCVSGGYGSAKTFAFALKATWLSDQFPKNRGLIARKKYVDLRDSTMKTFFKVCPGFMYDPARGGARSDTDKRLRFCNGSEVLWMHLEDQDIEGVIRGLEINWFFLDQAEEVKESVFDLLLTRLSRWDQVEVPQHWIDSVGGDVNWEFKNPATGRCIAPPYAMLACNPEDETHWIWRRFHPESKEWREKWRKRGYRMITMASHENKFLPKSTLEELQSKDAAFVRRYVEGKWGNPEGQIHHIDPLSILSTDPEAKTNPSLGVYVDGHAMVEHFRKFCTLHRSLDHGDASPTCCIWWASDKDGNVIGFREYYKPNRLISDHRAAITKLSEGERYRTNVADPSIFSPTMQKHAGRWSVDQEYSDRVNLPADTAIDWDKGDNDELSSRNAISEYLRVDPDRIHPVTKEKGAPRMFFLMSSPYYPLGCERLVTEIKSQRRVKEGEQEGRPIFTDERDENVPDHAYDCARYLALARPPRAPVPTAELPGDCLEMVRRRHKEFMRRGGYQAFAHEEFMRNL